MKAKYFLGLLLLAGISFTSCKSASDSSTETTVEGALQPDVANATVTWTAYKTTEKVPVNGNFTKVTIEDYGVSDNWEEVVNGLVFSISSFNIDTKDPDRDLTIVDNFFAKMVDAGNISGEVMKEGSDWFVNLKMNGVKVDLLPATVTYEGNTAHLSTTIDLNQFDALNALHALNEACHDLHMAADGVSKTWDTVDVTATLQLN